MNKIIIIFLFPISCFLWLGGCVDVPLVDRGLDFGIVNKTVDTIAWYVPPTMEALSSEGLPLERPMITRNIPPDESYGVFLFTTGNNNYFDELPTDTLHIFILNYEIYRTVSWDSIVVNNLIVERVKITEDSLKAIEYNITIE